MEEIRVIQSSSCRILIQRDLRRLLHGRTSFVIAHRLSTIREHDRFVVMHLGRVGEQGTHDDLLARGSLSAALHGFL